MNASHYDTPNTASDLAANGPRPTPPATFGLVSATPPPTDTGYIMQRADEVSTLQRMMNDSQTSAVMLIGAPGTGKSTLAALLFQRMLLSQQASLPTPRYLVWLSLGSFTTLPDMIIAILSRLDASDPGFFLLKPEQQISSLLRALRRPQQNALIVLDQFELLLHPETNQGAAGRGVLPLFLDMLQTDLGQSRILLTGYNSPYPEHIERSRVRSCLVTRISIPEGLALLQQHGIQASPEELSVAWQRCTGHVFSLQLLHALIQISNIPLPQLLNAPQFQPLWAGDVTLHLIATIYHYLNPIQYVLLRALSLFHQPTLTAGALSAVTGTPQQLQEQIYETLAQELERLCQYALIQKLHDASGQVCYSMHATLRMYILEHFLEGYDQQKYEALTALGLEITPPSATNMPDALQLALASAHIHVAAYYHRFARLYCPPREKRGGLHDIEPYISAVRHLCLGGHWQAACDLLFKEGLHEQMVQWGAWNTLIGLYTAMLPPFGKLQSHDQGMLLSYVGMLYGRLGEQKQSHAYLEQALHAQRQIADQRGEITTLVNLGELLRLRNERDQARIYLEQALLLNQQSQDPSLQCIALHNLGLIYDAEKDFQRAYECYQQSLKLVQVLSNKQYRGMILTSLGMLLYEQGLLVEGMAILLAALKMRQMLQDPTALLLEIFLRAFEQKLGTEAYGLLFNAALQQQKDVFTRFVPLDT